MMTLMTKKAITILVVIVGIIAVGILFFVPGEIGREQAIEKVGSLPEVAEFVKLLSDNGKVAHFDTEKTEDGDWSVHVYEIVDDGEISHTATFGWYEVSKKTGEVRDVMSNLSE